MPSLPPAYPAFSFVSCPHPPAPLPLRGRGIFTFHMQGAPPLASPRLRRRRHGLNLRCRCPLGGLPGWLPADLATVVSAGAACLRCRLPTPPFACFFAPIPPPPSPPGKGETLGYFMQGAPPLASPAPEPEATRDNPAEQIPGGGLSGWLPADRVTVVPARGACLLCRLLAPAFSLLSFPHPPSPLPLRGRGRFLLYFAGGFAPATPALNRSRHLQFLPYRCPAGARPPRRGRRRRG